MQFSLNGGRLLNGGTWSSPTACTFQQAHKYPGQGEEMAKFIKDSPSGLSALKLVTKRYRRIFHCCVIRQWGGG